MDEPLLTVSEAALALRVSDATLRRMIANGELHAVRLGRHDGRTIRIPHTALREAASRPATKEQP